MENPTPSVEKVLVPYQESIDSAAKLIEDNKERLDAAIMECYGQTDMARCIRKIPETVACAYSGHGITKGTYSFQRVKRIKPRICERTDISLLPF